MDEKAALVRAHLDRYDYLELGAFYMWMKSVKSAHSTGARVELVQRMRRYMLPMFATMLGACSFGIDLPRFFEPAGPQTKSDASVDVDAAAPADATLGFDVGATKDVGGSPLTYRDAILADKPRAFFRFGESAPSMLARDETGNSNEGDYEPGTVLGAAGAIALDPNTAANFSGGGLRAPARLDFSGRAQFSLEAWANVAITDNSYRKIFSKGSLFASGREQIAIYLQEPDGLVFERYVGGFAINVSTLAPTKNVWHHIVATYGGSISTLYVDGVSAGAVTDTRSQLAKTTPLYIGEEGAEGQFSWLGTLDEVAVYDRALVAADVARHFAIGRGR
jgi:hypothetical protein